MMSTFAIQQKTTCDHSFIVEGLATSSTVNSLSDTQKNWPLNLMLGKQLIIIYGTGIGQVVSVVSNTHNQIFINRNWTIQPDGTSIYRIRVNSTQAYCPKCLGANEYRDLSFAGGKRKTLTGISKFAQIVDACILSKSGASIFNPDFGSSIDLVLSGDTVDDEEIDMYLESSVIRAMNFLSIKQQEAIPKLKFDDSELFGQLQNVSSVRDADDPTISELTVEVTASNNQPAVVTAPLNTR